MAGFPFLAPLKDWAVEKLKQREQDPNLSAFLSPFIILSSAAVICKKDKANDVLALYASESWPKDATTYCGCVVANTTDISNLYQTAETIVGYDLNGKPIKVEGEKNRRISTPIIESLEIDTDGGNNTLKTAQLKIKVFSLKQLEMFELFFLRPSMNVVLEYGYTPPPQNNKDKIEIGSRLFAKKNHNDYIKEYTKIYSKKENAYKAAKVSYLKTLEDTKGTYDFMAGKISNFTISPDATGLYDISLEISAGNELQLWSTVKQKKKDGKALKKGDKSLEGFKTWITKLSADLNYPDLATIYGDEAKWKNEFFNWGIVTEQTKDANYNKDEYISVRLILDIINNISVLRDSPEDIKPAYFEDKDGKKPVIPINTFDHAISTTTDFILPGDLPKIFVETTTDKKDIISISIKDKVKFPINGYKFALPVDAELFNSAGVSLGKQPPIGNLLNVFIKYESFVNSYNSAYVRADVVNWLCDLINVNMFGKVKLELQKPSDEQCSEPMTLIDIKLFVPKPKIEPKDIYRFKIGPSITNGKDDKPQSGILHDFSFNMELSTLMQAQALYGTQIAINAAKAGKTDIKDVKKDTESQLDPYAHANLSFAKNSDGYVAINAIEVLQVKEKEAWNKKLQETAKATSNTTLTAKPDEATTSPENMTEAFKKDIVRFKGSPEDQKKIPFPIIYKNKSVIQNEIETQPSETTALTYLDVTFGIDGMAGFSCGEFFHIDGVPEIYNREGYFQITNVKHGIDASGWKTTIEAGYRIAYSDKK
jgi:hypothetical protein